MTKTEEESPKWEPNYVRIPKPKDFIPVTHFVEGERWEGHPRCQEWARSQGRQCGKRTVGGTKKCYSHGGANAFKKLRGSANPNYSHGRYSSSVASNTELAEAYEIALKQKGLLNLSPNIAMTDAQLALLYEDSFSANKELVYLSQKIYDLWVELKIIIPRNEPQVIEGVIEFNVAIGQLAKLLKDQKNFNQREDELTERRRRLTETETRRQVSTAETVLKAEAIGIFASIGNLFREMILEEVTERKEQRRVLGRFADIVDSHVVRFFAPEEKND